MVKHNEEEEEGGAPWMCLIKSLEASDAAALSWVFGVNPCFSCSASPGVLSVGSQGCALEEKITWRQATESRSGRKLRNHQETLKSLTGLGQQDKRETVCFGCYTNVAMEFLFLGMFSQNNGPDVDLGAAKPPRGFPKPPAALLLKLAVYYPCPQRAAPSSCHA